MIHISRARRRLSVAACAVVLSTVTATLAGCSGSPHPNSASQPPFPVPQVAPADTTRPPPTSHPAGATKPASAPVTHSARPSPPPPSRSASPPPSPAPSQSSSPPGPKRVQPCPTSGLRGSFGTPTGAGGSFYYPIQFTNASGSPCTLYGYPGVSAVTSAGGSQIGPQATRIGTFAPRFITLAVNAVVHATMRMPNPGVVGSGCKPKTVRWLRVFPPGQFTALYVSVPTSPNPVQICTGSHLGSVTPIAVYVVLPGASGP